MLIVSCLLVACASENGDADNGDNSILSMWNRYPELNNAVAELIEALSEENPRIKIELQNIPISSQTASYQSAVSEDTLPDIWTTAVVSLDELVDLDKVKDLNELFPQEVKDDYYPGTWFENGTTLNGDVYVLSFFLLNLSVN